MFLSVPSNIYLNFLIKIGSVPIKFFDTKNRLYFNSFNPIMEETTEIKLENHKSTSLTMMCTQFLLVTVFLSCLVIIVQYYRKRNLIYKRVVNFDGPKSYPIIGNAHLYRGSTEGNLYFLYKINFVCLFE